MGAAPGNPAGALFLWEKSKDLTQGHRGGSTEGTEKTLPKSEGLREVSAVKAAARLPRSK